MVYLTAGILQGKALKGESVLRVWMGNIISIFSQVLSAALINTRHCDILYVAQVSVEITKCSTCLCNNVHVIKQLTNLIYVLYNGLM